ncbi:MAG: bifunctional serine/threonine-protein kinase/formylglycine-generating enzyme family protein [Planctomycetota bacterium]|jgi:serine/threonine protein kinase
MIGKTVSHYRILEKLGEGGMGVVYKAQDTKLDRAVALKFLPSELTRDEEAKKRFVQEARAASALEHPNICNIHEIDETEYGQMFICMACYEGETLKRKVEAGPMKLQEAVDVAVQIAGGLSRAHEAGITHRDVKPGNIIVTERDEVKILDFGLAKMAGRPELTKTRTTLGTVAYMSPEQARGEKVDHRTDIWSLGVVLYEMLAGRRPFGGDHEQAVVYSILNEEPTSLEALRPEVPETLRKIVVRALSKDPTSRFSSAAQMLQELREYRSTLGPAAVAWEGRAFLQLLRRPRIAVPMILAVAVLCLLGLRLYQRSSKIRWARHTALPEIVRLKEKFEFVEAFHLAQNAEQYIPDDPQLSRLKSRISLPVWIRTTPDGADVYYKDYMTPDAAWEFLGRSPIDSALSPDAPLRWEVRKEGFETEESFDAGLATLVDTLRFVLQPQGSTPVGMVRVPGGSVGPWGVDPVGLQDYWIDKHEVTNREYKEFVDAGGYRRQEYWKQPFVKDGLKLSREESMAEFRDATGRSGPSTWRLGTYPDGQADYPVSGVSWYEAAAYAEFRGRSLPTVYHWSRAAHGTGIFSPVLLLANFRGEGLVPAGSHGALSPFGSYDMAGNVKEWCWNRAGNLRYVLGGAWNEPSYMFAAEEAASPFERHETFGFRCAKYDESLPEVLTGPLVRSLRDYRMVESISDDIFRVYESMYAYDSTALDAEIESVDESSELWRRETVTFDAAYRDERVIAHLCLPMNATPPYQTVIFFPGGNALDMPSSRNAPGLSFLQWVPRSGRALLFPVYQGTFERRVDYSDWGWNEWRDLVIEWSKDLGRSIDYLETREDIDSGKLAYVGISMGGVRGPIFTAIEERLKASVLIGGGLGSGNPPPEIDPVHFAPRSKTPTLMINGSADFIFPLETSQVPLFQLLGTPAEDKRHAVLEGGHIPDWNEMFRETLDWLDLHLGPVD